MDGGQQQFRSRAGNVSIRNLSLFGLMHAVCAQVAGEGNRLSIMVSDWLGGIMVVTKHNGIYSAQHITGPTHNLLRLKLRRGGGQAFSVTVLPSVGQCQHHSGLTAEEMAPAIQAGVARANADLGTDYAVEDAEIVANDSRQPAVYELLACRIVQEAAKRSRQSNSS